MALPNFLCVGAEKGGTTPLFHLVRQHPDVFVPPGKETHFFSRATEPLGLALYEAMFFGDYAGQRAVGEFTADYMRVPGNARRLRELLPASKIVFCLREPLRRAFSHYHHSVRLLEENRSFLEACEADAQTPLGSPSYAAMRRAYVRGSLYPAAIAEFAREFGRGNLFFLILERDLATDDGKRRMLERLFRFLEVDPRALAAINLAVPNTSLPCPAVRFIAEQAARAYVTPDGRTVPIGAGDIVFTTGNRYLDRIVRRPSDGLRRFFSKMAEELTRELTAEERDRLRERYFAGVVDETSDIVGSDLRAFWCEGAQASGRANTG